VRKKYACPACESNGDNPQMETAAKPETAIDKGMAGPGLLAYIVTSKFADYLPLSAGRHLQRQGSRSRGRRNRSGAAMWPIWSSRCMN
jgi:transposase